jgi:hypothetical protein
VSISSPDELACSGLMYSGVPTSAPARVNIVSAVSPANQLSKPDW